MRALFFAFGAASYALFFVTFLYLIGFLGNFAVPKTIDSGPEGPVVIALVVNTLLVALFAVQHTVMARPGFKSWWTRLVPQPIERSTYVLLSTVILILLIWQWRPIGYPIWSVEAPAAVTLLRVLFLAGFGMVLYATFLIDHFDLFGLRQVYLHLRGRPYEHRPFSTPSLYRLIRHPLYVGWIMAFWITPTMTVGHLTFALLSTAYIFVAIVYEERDLIAHFGEDYRRYRLATPMIVPIPRR